MAAGERPPDPSLTKAHRGHDNERRMLSCLPMLVHSGPITAAITVSLELPKRAIARRCALDPW
jgi:hypothetical protein